MEERRVRPLGRRQGARAHRTACTTAPASSRASAPTRPSAARPSSACPSTWTGSHKSAGLYYLEIPYSAEELREATTELIARNGLRSCYIRPLAFRGYGEMGLYANSAPVDVIIAVWPWGAYLGDESAGKGIRAKVSSWRRNSPGGAIPHAKASGSYLNSILAKTESANAGYDEAILLDERGFVSEGSGENIFVVRDGEILTPPHTASILDGINRKSVIQIARDLGYTVVERDIARAELYLAEEVFLTGTAAEMVPVREIDDHAIGGPGEITRHVQAKFDGRPARARRGVPRVARLRRASGRTRRVRATPRSGELPLPPSGRRGSGRARRAARAPPDPSNSKGSTRWNR